MFRRARRPAFHSLFPLHRSSLPLPFRSVRSAAGLPAARPFFARIACARVRAFAPARFARLIAREPSAGRTSPVRSVGGFSHRCEAGDEAASGCRFLLSHPTTDSTGSSHFENYFIIREQSSASGRRRRDTSCDVMRPLSPPVFAGLLSPRRAHVSFFGMAL